VSENYAGGAFATLHQQRCLSHTPPGEAELLLLGMCLLTAWAVHAVSLLLWPLRGKENTWPPERNCTLPLGTRAAARPVEG